MNVFEDLVVELQEENLLETTFINDRGPRAVEAAPENKENYETQYETDSEVQEFSDDSYGDVAVADEPAYRAGAEPEEKYSEAEFDTDVVVDQEYDVETPIEVENSLELLDEQPSAEEAPKKAASGREFYKKRAVGEVSNLQMVEHVLTGVEREYMKVRPSTFDDFNVKKALNAYLKVIEGDDELARQEAEFLFVQETESWCSALGQRDKNMPVSLLRQYCENSRPALSSQAMLALARFYRNLPYTEHVRGKFDFVITRLFSRPVDHAHRSCLFQREDSLKHINTLYREWSSISLYAAEGDESKVKLTALSFDDLADEAENAANFDQLIESDFFGRLRLFKESISELFYAPSVTVSAIEANIRIGNSYVDLIRREREKLDAEAIHTKYIDFSGEAISEAAGRTLDLVDLLRNAEEDHDESSEPAAEPEIERELLFDRKPAATAPEKAEVKKPKVHHPLVQRLIDNAKGVNKWFLSFAILLILASVGIYVWANFLVVEELPPTTVRTTEITKRPLGDFVKTAKVSGENLYLLMNADWDTLSKEKRQDALQQAWQVATEMKCKQVNLLAKDGKPAGFASAGRIEVITP